MTSEGPTAETDVTQLVRDAALADAFALAVHDSWTLPSGVRVVSIDRLAEIVAHVARPSSAPDGASRG